MLVLLHFLRFLGILSNPKISDLKLIPPPPYITIPVLVTVTAGGWGRRQWVTGAVASCPIGVRCPVPVPSPAQTSRTPVPRPQILAPQPGPGPVIRPVRGVLTSH